MPTSFRTNSAGWSRLLRSRGVQESTNRGAQKIVDNAKDIAPTGPARGITGRYHDSLKVKEAHGGAAAESHAVADVPYADWVEARHNTLGRAMHP